MKIFIAGGPVEDSYGFAKRFREMSNEQLAEAFNRQVDNPGWVGAKINYVQHLGNELQLRGIDCSSIIENHVMVLDRPVMLIGRRLVTFDPDVISGLTLN
jgi:hypothetical protein